MWTLYWVYGLVDRSFKSRPIQPCRMCTAVCAACNRATSARNWRTSTIRDSVSVIAPVSGRLTPMSTTPAGSTREATPESDNSSSRCLIRRCGPAPRSIWQDAGSCPSGLGRKPVPVRFQLVIDCADPDRLARFWAAALGYQLAPPPAGFATWNDFYRDLGVPEQELPAGADRISDPDGRGPGIWFHVVPGAKTAARN